MSIAPQNPKKRWEYIIFKKKYLRFFPYQRVKFFTHLSFFN
ncbi:hypothetical protein TPE_1681 [Treponema pedis str. T A4]|uniref:Uncharacterized protein n=1 Tax=Treponema pedis str. T A4 TaxID=1291379 RepID=S6A0G1_9SPIR|nr:hypothetical protein TPE_1681 [Treponema pedis str. T A4]